MTVLDCVSELRALARAALRAPVMAPQSRSPRRPKRGHIAQPVRVAITGTTISPSIFETLERLGKTSTIARVKRCLTQRESVAP